MRSYGQSSGVRVAKLRTHRGLPDEADKQAESPGGADVGVQASGRTMNSDYGLEEMDQQQQQYTVVDNSK